MDETYFHSIADATLDHLFDRLEDAYEDGSLEDLELEGGILTIVTASERTLIVNKHAPSMQLWLASPTIGGLHFRFDEAAQLWALPDGRKLYDVLRDELKREGVEVVL